MGMETSHISWLFALIIFVICALLVAHIVFRLWRQRGLLHQLNEQHRTIIHSLPMSLGMISTMTICIIVGAILSNNISAAYIMGFLVGVIVSGVITFPFQDEIAILDGVVAGSMGGLMGVMVGVMTPVPGVYTVATLLTALFIASWMIMYRRICQHIVNSVESAPKGLSNTENMNGVHHTHDKEGNSLTQEWLASMQQEVRAAVENEREIMFEAFKQQTNAMIERGEGEITREMIDEIEQKQLEIAATQKESKA